MLLAGCVVLDWWPLQRKLTSERIRLCDSTTKVKEEGERKGSPRMDPKIISVEINSRFFFFYYLVGNKMKKKKKEKTD